MPSDDNDLNGRIQGERAPCSSQEEIARWMRIPEAWDALRALPPIEAGQLPSLFDLVASVSAQQKGQVPPAWDEVQSMDKHSPDDLAEVIRLAAALQAAADAGRTEDIVRVVSERPNLWRSPLALAWPTRPHTSDLARELIAQKDPSSLSLLTNALLASGSPIEASATFSRILENEASPTLAELLEAGQDDIAAAVAVSLPVSKDALLTPETTIEAAIRAQAQGDLALARHLLINGWDRATELDASYGDRLADVAVAQGDPVSACEALKRAILLHPSRERQARIAALLAEMGRNAEALQWMPELPETVAEHTAAAMVALAQDDPRQAADHVHQAVALLATDRWTGVAWLRRLATAAQRLEHSALAIPALERLVQLKPQDGELRESLAKHLLTAGRADEAAAHAQALAGLHPDSDDTRRLLARSMRAAGQCEQALDQWKGLAQPTHDDQLEAGQCALAASEPEYAISIARDILRSHPGSPAALVVLGQALVAAGKPEEALAHLRAACAANPHQPAAWTAVAECEAASGDPQAAGNTLAAAVQAAPGDARLWYAYASWLREQGRASEALEASAKSVADPGTPVEHQLVYGELLTAMGHPDQASDVLHKALATHPSSWPIRCALAKALIASEQTSEAASVVAPVAASSGPAALAFAGRVLAEHALNAHDPATAHRAIDLLGRATKDSPTAEIEVSTGKALEACGELESAFNHYRASLDGSSPLTSEDYCQASLGLARCATALRRSPAAIHALESAAQTHGATPELQIALSVAYAAAGQHRRAFEAAKRASELAPGEASLRQLTSAASQAGEIGTALEAIRRLVSLEPSNPHVWLTLAEVSAQSKDAAQARAALANGIRRAGEDAAAWSRASDLLLRNARPISAQRALRRALACSPRDADLVRQMAEVSQHAGDIATAQRAWIRFGELRHNDCKDLKLAARSLSLLGQRAMAIGLWQKAISLDPQDADAQCDLARAYLTEGDIARALALYRSVPCQGNTAMALEAAAAELHYGSPEAAVELFRTAARQAPKDPTAWQGLGEGLLMLRRSDEALPALETAYQLDPSRVQTMAALSVAALDTGDAPMAAAMYQSAQRRPCENALAAALLARAAVALLQWDEVLAPLDQLNASSPSLASLRAAIEMRLRIADAAWIFRAADAQAHGPAADSRSDSAAAQVDALIDRLAGVAPSWETARLRQRARVTFGEADPFTFVEAAGSDPTGEALEGTAIAVLQKGRAEEALSLLRPGTTSTFGRWQRLITGMACAALARPEDARQAFEQAASDPALRPLAAYLSARTYLGPGDVGAFAARASSALVEWGTEPAWHFELANAYVQLGQLDAALPHLHQAEELAPGNCDCALALARTAQQVGDLASAQMAYGKAVDCRPTDGQVCKEAALCALCNGDAEMAATWFETARRLLPGDVETLIGSARTSLVSDDVRLAHQHAQAAYHLAPDDSEVLQVLGQVFARQGKLDRALQSFDQALRRASDPLPVHIARARLLIQIGRSEQAIQSLKAAVAKSPDSDAGWAALAEIEDAAGMLPEALDACGRAVQLSPRNPVHRLQLGRLCRKSGQLDRALDELLRAQLTGLPGGRVSFEIGRVYEERREFKRSLDAYQQVIDLDPTHGQAHYRAGLVLKQIKAYPQAGKMLKRAVELNPKDPEALHQLAAVRALELVHGGIAHQAVAP
jgi:tetratricopeptide (TPR) repeat protein